MADVFISYARRDQEFVRELYDALTERGRDVWVDWEGIPPTAEWREELRRSIEEADAFLYVITPDSVASEVCADEVEMAVAGNKRLIPVVRKDVPDSEVPERVAALNWIFFREGDDSDEALGKLVKALDTDLDWVQAHTRLLVRAGEWAKRGRDGSLLLRGRDLASAEEVVAAAAGKEPRPTELQNEYLLASRRAATRRQRLGIVAALTVAAVSLFLGAVALLQRNEARNQSQIATSRERAATSQRLASEDPELGLLLAASAADIRLTDEVREALVNALRRWPLITGLTGFDGPLTGAAVTPDRRFAVTAGTGEVVRVWDLVTGRSRVLGRDVGLAERVELSPDGAWALTPGEGGARLWRRSGGPPVVLQEPSEVVAAAFGADGARVITGDLRGDARIWDTDRRRVVTRLPVRAAQGRHGFLPGGVREPGRRAVQDVALSVDGSLAATAFFAQTVYVWDARRARYLWRLPGSRASFSPDGRLLAVAHGFDARIWDVARRRPIAVLANHTGVVRSVQFSVGGDRLVTSGDDRTARVWSVAEGRQIGLLIHSTGVRDARFSPDDEVVVTADEGGRLSVWDPGQTSPLTAVGESTRSVVFVGERRLGVADRDGARLVDDRLGARLVELADGTPRVLDLDADGSGRRIALVAEDGSLLLFDAESGRELWRKRLPRPAEAVTFSPDGRRLVTAGQDGVARIWDARGRQLSRLRHPAPLNWAGLAADGRHTFTQTRAGEDSKLAVWRGTQLIRVEDLVLADVSADGSRIAVADAGVVRVVGVATNTETVLRGEDATSQFIPRLSADGQLLLTTGNTDRVARLWDLESESVVARAPGRVQVSGAAFTPDGRLFAVGRRDGAVEVLETATGRTVVTLDAGGIAVYMRFGPASDALAIIDVKGRGRLLSCDACRPVEDLVELARSRATRELSEEERELYLHE